MWKYEKEHIDYVRSIAKGRYNDEIAKMFNKRFNVNKTAAQINAMKGNHKITSGELPKRAGKKLFSDEQEKFLRENARGLYSEELTERFNKQFDLDRKVSQIKSWKARNKVSSGLTGHFRKGHETWNKGMKGLDLAGENGRKTQFKKGQTPINYRPVGSERIDSKDGYIVIKVQDEGTWQERWKHKHVVVWENAHGKVPDNHVISFLDSDKTNVDIENLALLTRSELVRMNQGKLFSDNPEQTLAGILLVRLNHRIMEVDLMGNCREEFEKQVERAARNGIARETFKARLRRGWSVRNAVNKPLYSRRSS